MDSSSNGEPIRVQSFTASTDLMLTIFLQQFWTSRRNIVNWDASQELPQMAGTCRQRCRVFLLTLFVNLVESTSDEWMDRGTIFMNNKKYQQARFCYQKAKFQEGVDIADAYLLLQDAEDLSRSAQSSDRDRSRRSFIKAAEAFTTLPHHSDWARQGALCFARGGDHLRSGQAYLTVPAYPEAAREFWRATDFESLYGILRSHRASLPTAEAQYFGESLKLHFIKGGEYE